MNLEDKKLLVLGGKPIGSIDIIEYALSKGVHTIVTDYLDKKDSPAKQLANENWDLSTSDLDKLYIRCKSSNVNAVFTGIHEFNISKTLQLANKLGVPFYATQEQLNITSIKSQYKDLFRKFNVPVVPEYYIDTDTLKTDVNVLEYPVLIKPVDSSGGRGISICYNEQELLDAYPKALEYSNSGKVLVEKYITAKEATIFYIIQEGKIMLTAMADRYIGNGDEYTIPLPLLYTFPSKHQNYYIENLNQNVINAFESIGLKNGMVFIQTFVDDKQFYLYDIGFRLTGSQEYYILEKVCGYNPLKMMVDYALTGKMGNNDVEPLIDPYLNGKFACNITFLAKPSTIGAFKGIEEVEKIPGVIKVVKNHQEGEVIPNSAAGTLNQVILRVFIVSDSFSEMKNSIRRSTELFDVFSDKGESVLMLTINIDEI